MTDKQDLIREIHEYVTTHGGENTATHLLVQAASAIQTQAAELEAVGAGGVQPLRSVQEGCKLVPLEPTPEMLAALMSPGEAEVLASSPSETFALMLMDRSGIRERYSAMLAASPTPPAEQQAAPKAAPGVGNSGFDHKTAADFLSGKTVSDEAVRKFVQASRWAHDEKAALNAMLLSVRGVLSSREAEIALLKRALMEAEAAPQQEAQEPCGWAVYDSLGFYELHDTEAEAKSFCDHYNKRPIDPKKPYTYRAHFTAPQPAPAPLSDDVVKDAARYRWLREHEGADGLIRSDCRGLYLPQRDALDSAVDALLFTTPSQRGEIAGDGKPCNNDHDPDCRWPDCRCRERERMAAAIDAARKQGASHDKT